jgi:hypothetical protein
MTTMTATSNIDRKLHTELKQIKSNRKKNKEKERREIQQKKKKCIVFIIRNVIKWADHLMKRADYILK